MGEVLILYCAILIFHLTYSLINLNLENDNSNNTTNYVILHF